MNTLTFNESDKANLQKPFIKWVGGKTQIIDNILERMPDTMNNYHEIFLGGGSVLLGVLSLQKQKRIIIKNKVYAYDLNKSLINTYNKIKNECSEVIKEVTILKNTFNDIEALRSEGRWPPKNEPLDDTNCKKSKEHYYYWIRDKYNNSDKDTALSAAYFIFLNKTGFKGMYREGKNGFNIPYGQKDKKKFILVIEEDRLNEVSELIQNVEFKCMSFTESLEIPKKGDYVYLDPPYVPEIETSFTGYTLDGFPTEKHTELFDKIKKLKCKFTMSNSKVELVTKAFSESKYTIDEVQARRAIHSKNPGSTTKEVIIYN